MTDNNQAANGQEQQTETPEVAEQTTETTTEGTETPETTEANTPAETKAL